MDYLRVAIISLGIALVITGLLIACNGKENIPECPNTTVLDTQMGFIPVRSGDEWACVIGYKIK